MIETICIPILFLALAINVPTMIAYLIGLQFQIKDPNCPKEVTNVKRNILATKIMQVFNVIVTLVLLILLSI